MRIEGIWFTQAGQALGERLFRGLRDLGHDAALSSGRRGGVSLPEWTGQAFARADALLFIGAAGIAVRAIAPFVRKKAKDPAVVVVDEGGNFAIPILSGHIGGANALAHDISGLIGAVAAITTATDVRRAFAVDVWAIDRGLHIVNPEKIVEVSSRVLDGLPVRIFADGPIWGAFPKGVLKAESAEGAHIVVSPFAPAQGGNALWLVPGEVAMGVGCRKGAGYEAIERAADLALERAGVHPLAISGVCSIDLKKEEPGLLEFCRRRGLSLATHPAEALAALPGQFTPSAFVKGITGVDNVCERSAVLESGGELIFPKLSLNGVTIALARKPISISF